MRNLQEMYDDLSNWQDNTPTGHDILKQRMQDRYVGTPDTSKSDRIATLIANEVKQGIVKEVPEYAKMVKDYEAASKQINEINKTMSLGNKAAIQTQLTKVMSVLKENFAARQDMIKIIEEATGKNIRAQVA